MQILVFLLFNRSHSRRFWYFQAEAQNVSGVTVVSSSRLKAQPEMLAEVTKKICVIALCDRTTNFVVEFVLLVYRCKNISLYDGFNPNKNHQFMMWSVCFLFWQDSGIRPLDLQIEGIALFIFFCTPPMPFMHGHTQLPYIIHSSPRLGFVCTYAYVRVCLLTHTLL